MRSLDQPEETRSFPNGAVELVTIADTMIGMNLNGILLGSEDPQRLTAYYSRLFGEPGWAGGDFRG